MLRENYYAFILSHIFYSVEIYANTKSTYLDKLMKLNNKLNFLEYFNIDHLILLYVSFTRHNTLLITDVHKQQLLFVHKNLQTKTYTSSWSGT